MTEKKMIEKESKKERTKDKEKNEYSSFHSDPLFDDEVSHVQFSFST